VSQASGSAIAIAAAVTARVSARLRAISSLVRGRQSASSEAEASPSVTISR
jgi:hypothetical protein